MLQSDFFAGFQHLTENVFWEVENVIDVCGPFVWDDTTHERYFWKFVEIIELMSIFVLESYV